MSNLKGTVGVQLERNPGRRIGANDARYWEKRLRKRRYRTADGKMAETAEWYIRLKERGKGSIFCLHTANRVAAANLARDIGMCARLEGLGAAEAKFRHRGQNVDSKVSVGAFLKAVESTGRLEMRTFLGYSNCLRTICSEIFGLREGRAKFDYRKGGNGKWRDRVDRVLLEKLTADGINSWAKSRLQRCSQAQDAKLSAKRTINNYIRSARSLFSDRRRNGNPSLLEEVRKSLSLPLPKVLPFAGVGLYDAGSMKFQSSGSRIPELWLAAQHDLRKAETECFKIFLFAALGGLRRGEIDGLEWKMIDLDTGIVSLEPTEWLHLKTEGSRRKVHLDPEVVSELRNLKTGAKSEFVVESPWSPRSDTLRRYYRCEPVFDRLIQWLTSNGIKSRKPLHELRKEVGALIATREGIYAASHFLGHSDITTTARHYAAMQRPVTVGLAALLNARKSD